MEQALSLADKAAAAEEKPKVGNFVEVGDVRGVLRSGGARGEEPEGDEPYGPSKDPYFWPFLTKAGKAS